MLLVLAGLVIWIVSLDFPEPPGGQLDASWQAALTDAHLHGLQFGRDVIFTFGPWGWLQSHFIQPGSLGGKLVWELGGKLLLAAALVGLSLALPTARRWVLLAATACFGVLFADTLFFLIITLAVAVWLFNPHAPRWLTVSTVAALAFLAQMKFTYALLVGAGVGAAAVSLVWRGALWRGLMFPAGAAAAYLLGWLAAGQNPVRLYNYWRYSWQLAAGYGQAMAFDETWPVFLAGATVALGAGAYLWRGVRRHPDRRVGRPLAFFLAFAWFLAWKHGFTRADGHVTGFFFFSLLLAVALPGLLTPARRWHWIDLCPVLCLAGISLFEPGQLLRSPAVFYERLVYNGARIFKLGGARARFTRDLERETKVYAMPALRAVVGAGAVDLFNYEQGLLLLNGLNYRPRPVFQSYSAYTPALLSKNLGFYRSARAPEFVVVKIQTIDGRHPMQDDSLALAELPRRYEVVDERDDYALFKKREAATVVPEAARPVLLEQQVGLGETIALPLERGHALWLQAWTHPSLIGRMRAALYKPAQLYLVLTGETGHETRYRLVPAVMEMGFLVQPLIETAGDYAGLARQRAGKRVRDLRFEAASPDEAEFWREVSVLISAVPDLPLKGAGKGIDLWQSWVELGIFSTRPVSIDSPHGPEVFSVGSAGALLVQAPGELVFTRPPEANRFEGVYGIRDGALDPPDPTDGAEFTIEAGDADGRSDIIWKIWLRPHILNSHRGPQKFSVRLPPGARRVILRTGPGSQNNADSDWTYWAGLRFLP